MLNTKKKSKTQHEDSNKKERHIVTWTQEEDDLLREQIGIHGTENWPIIASKFKDKTTRQCRRRWYTYLNSDFKKGGWSPEEDILLCEAQKIFGNRWTEIAKVVSGRTDNAVKNRFSTLCKKKAKYEALVKENKVAYINSNSKRVLSHDTLNTDARAESAAPPKKIRKAHIPSVRENHSLSYRSHIHGRVTFDEQPRPPFAVLIQNFHNSILASQNQVSDDTDECRNGQITKTEGIFLKKDDPKMAALMQQAELLTSLTDKVNPENINQSLENAWKVLQDILTQSKDNGIFRYGIPDIDFQIEGFKEMVEDIANNDEGSRISWRQPDLCEESPASSEYSSGSTASIHTANYTTEEIQAENKDDKSGLQPADEDPENGLDECEKEFLSSVIISQADELPKAELSTLQSCNDQITNDGIVPALPNLDFSSPVQVTPLFRSLAATIPSPKFSESERSFLMKTLGIESFSPSSNANPPRPPPCKRALLQSL